jgi:hypothetical protein
MARHSRRQNQLNLTPLALCDERPCVLAAQALVYHVAFFDKSDGYRDGVERVNNAVVTYANSYEGTAMQMLCIVRQRIIC